MYSIFEDGTFFNSAHTLDTDHEIQRLERDPSVLAKSDSTRNQKLSNEDKKFPLVITF